MSYKSGSGCPEWYSADDPLDRAISTVKEMHAKGALLQRTDGFNYYWIYPNIIEGTGEYVIKAYLNGSEITTGFTVDYNTGVFTFTVEIDETTGGVTNLVTADFYYLIQSITIIKHTETADTSFTFSQITSDMDLQYVNAGDKFYYGVFNALLASLDNGFPGKAVTTRQTVYGSTVYGANAEKQSYETTYLCLPVANPSFERTDGWTADSGCTFTRDSTNSVYHGAYCGKLVVASGGTFKGIKQTVTLDSAVSQVAFCCLIKPDNVCRITVNETGEAVNEATITSSYADRWWFLIVKTPAGSMTSIDIGIYPQAVAGDTGTCYVDHACLIQYPVGESIC